MEQDCSQLSHHGDFWNGKLACGPGEWWVLESETLQSNAVSPKAVQKAWENVASPMVANKETHFKNGYSGALNEISSLIVARVKTENL